MTRRVKRVAALTAATLAMIFVGCNEVSIRDVKELGVDYKVNTLEGYSFGINDLPEGLKVKDGASAQEICSALDCYFALTKLYGDNAAIDKSFRKVKNVYSDCENTLVVVNGELKQCVVGNNFVYVINP